MDWLTDHKIPLGKWIKSFVDLLLDHAAWFFDFLSELLEFPIEGLTALSLALPPLLLVDSFGQDGYGTAYGVTAASMFSMAGLATAAGGWLFDATGAYVWPLLGLTGLHLLAGLLVLWHGRRQRSREARL